MAGHHVTSHMSLCAIALCGLWILVDLRYHSSLQCIHITSLLCIMGYVQLLIMWVWLWLLCSAHQTHTYLELAGWTCEYLESQTLNMYTPVCPMPLWIHGTLKEAKAEGSSLPSPCCHSQYCIYDCGLGPLSQKILELYDLQVYQWVSCHIKEQMHGIT